MNWQFIKMIGASMLFGTFLVMILTFYTAYNNPDKSVKIFIDKRGEADFEAWVLIPVIAVFGTISYVLELVGGYRKLEEKKENGKK